MYTVTSLNFARQPRVVSPPLKECPFGTAQLKTCFGVLIINKIGFTADALTCIVILIILTLSKEHLGFITSSKEITMLGF